MKNWLKLLFFFVSTGLFSLNADVYSEYENQDILISPEEAVKLIGNEKVMFVSGDSGDVFKLGHIKGSVEMYAHHLHHADIMGHLHCSPLFQCIEDAEKYIGGKGITNDMTIIAYDDYKGPNATGVYHFFKSYGHENVKILNGGRFAITQLDPNMKIYDEVKDELSKAKRTQRGVQKQLKKFERGRIKLSEAQVAQLEAMSANADEQVAELEVKLADAESKLLVVKGEEEVEAVEYHIDHSKIDTTYVATKHDVKHAVDDILKNGADSEYVIVDTRGMIEIIGERKMDNVARGGHVPGATFLEWKHISDGENKRSFRSAEDLKAVFEKFGITKDKKVYAYCHVGTGRSSEIITALQLLGYPYAKIFSGSWDTWGNDMNLPIKR
jgi:thiosulfate/3-mercaptopyruvate sulfurtransferase